jgi:hypothetical protein
MPRSRRKARDLIDDARALADQSLAHAVQRLQIKLLGCLGGNELHRRPLDCFGDRLRIAEVVLLALRVRANILCRHQSGVVTKGLELAVVNLECGEARESRFCTFSVAVLQVRRFAGQSHSANSCCNLFT